MLIRYKSALIFRTASILHPIRHLCTSGVDNDRVDNDRVDNEGIVFEDADHRLHVPVMAEQVLDIMHPQNGQSIIDLTFGAGGHSRQILGAAPDVRLLAVDRDPLAHNIAKKLAKTQKNLLPILGRFSELPLRLHDMGIGAGSVNAVLMDLGASSMQFDRSDRGFRISANGPLDMRMDGNRSDGQMSAADVVNTLDERALESVLRVYGEERRARVIAAAIVESRYAFGEIVTTRQLTNIVQSVFDEGIYRKDKLNRSSHVATKTFQALRIFVNDELNELEYALRLAHRLLVPGGLCLAISFHSLEDRLVKRAFNSRVNEQNETSKKSMTKSRKRDRRNWEYGGYLVEKELQEVTKKFWCEHKMYEPSLQEVDSNPRARSAKLRVATKLE